MATDKKIIIDTAWDDSDDDELIDYAEKQPYQLLRLDSEEIMKQNPTEIEALFCNTEIFQKFIPGYQPPETYPSELAHLYKRELTISTLAEVLTKPFPFFIKPVTNNKAFTGMVIRDYLDLESIKQSGLERFYVAEVINYVAEFRLFIKEKAIYGLVESTYHVLGRQPTGTQSPIDFLDQIIKFNPYRYAVIDIGLTAEGVWNVVEVNPPFALNNYDWPIDKYYNYCRDAWLDIVSQLKIK